MARPVEPRPLRQSRAKTLFLRVPSPVWGMVSTGRVREFRAASGNVPQVWTLPLPTLAVAYRRRLSTTEYDYRLMLLEDVRREALGAITDAGLAAAGYTGEGAFARFRRDWTINEKRRFAPLRSVVVFTVRPVERDDLYVAGRALVDHLYGSYIADAQAQPRTIQANGQAASTTRTALATGRR